jgi:hypothetical protein
MERASIPPLDLFRYSAPGVHVTSIAAHSPYFSINNGVTNRGNYSTVADFADWNYSLVRGDAFGGASSGTTLAITPNDLIEEAVLGYNFTAVVWQPQSSLAKSTVRARKARVHFGCGTFFKGAAVLP